MSRSVVLAAAVVAVPAVLHSAAWMAGCFMLERGVRNEGPALAEQGWLLQAGPASWTGWPLAAALRLPRASLTAAPDRPLVTWSADALELRLSPLHPTVLDAVPQGSQSVRLGSLPPLAFQAGEVRVSFPLDRASPPQLVAARLTADTPAGPVTVGQAALRGRPAAFVAELRDIALPPALHRLLEADVAWLTLRASLTPPVPLAGTPQASAAAWQAAGGSVDVPDMALRWGPLDMTGHGAARLDAQLQPQAEAALTVAGYAETLDALVRSGALPARTASAAKAVLGLIALAARGGPIPMPVTLRDGVLVAGGFPLLRLPGLDWSAMR